MTYQPYIAYIVAWDWLLWGLYAFIALMALFGIVAIAFVEYDSRRRPTDAGAQSKLISAASQFYSARIEAADRRRGPK